MSFTYNVPRRRNERLREQIVDAAYRLFAERGYHQTHVSTIAAELQLGHGTFYRYFENKLAIFVAVIDRVIARLSEVTVGDPPGAESAAAYREQVERIGARLFDVFTGDPHLARIVLVEAVGIDELVSARAEAAFSIMAAVTRAYLEHGVARGFLRAELDCERTARLINACILEGARGVLRAESGARSEEGARWRSAAIALLFEGVGGGAGAPGST